MRARHLGILAVVLCAVSVAAVPAHANDDEISIRLTIEDRSQLEDLTRRVSIDDVRGLEVRAVATPAQLEDLVAAGYVYERLPARDPSIQATMCPSGWVADDARSWSCYPTYGQYVALLQRFASEHPDICRLTSIGAGTNTARPHELWMLEITDHPDVEENEPEVLYTSSMHGDELAGFPLLLRLADELLDGYGVDPELTAIVDGFELHINPLANPDGAYFSSDDDVSAARRYLTTTSGGSSGVDANRNFPDPDDGDHPDGRAWWAETLAMMAFADTHSIALAANFHGGAEVVNYPWDTWRRAHPEEDWYVALSRAYAEQVQADAGQNGYMTDLDDGITNGFAWYPVAGGRQDYMNFFHGAREVTIELSGIKLLPAGQLDAHWSYNRQALLDFIGAAARGVRGIVTDRDGGLPLDATVEVLGRDTVADGSVTYTDPDVGDYHRMLPPGTYTLRFSALGYLPEDRAGVVVGSGAATVLDVDLAGGAPGCVDGDGDGYGSPGDASCPAGPESDCNDADPTVNPGAVEIPDNGIDDDCDPSTPTGCGSEQR